MSATVTRMELSPSGKSVLLGADGQALSLDVVPVKNNGPATDEHFVGSGIVSMFERMACDPNASVEKIERLMALWERSESKRAESLFNAAMSAAQAEMKAVAADAHNPHTHSRYASYAALDRALRPIYTKHGFALSFNTGEAPQTDYVRVLCDVTHLGGFAKPYKADMPADGKGAKQGDVMTKTHATGSAMSYGMRYLLKMIFNIAVGEDDDDGNAAGGKGKPTAPPPPEGFTAWWAVLSGLAEDGFPALETAWNKSQGAFKNYVSKHQPSEWAALKAKALKVQK